jgi:hypothetical protein
MNPKRISIYILLLFFAEFSVLQAQNLITVYPEENPIALSNPLKGFRPDGPGTKYPRATIVRDYITWNAIENDSTDGVQKIIDYCNARWKDFEKKNVKVIPRVYILWDENAMPGNWPSDLTPGDWTSQKFKDRVVKLIYKLGLAWDNDPRVAWVQTGIIGWWGEQESPVGINAEYAKLLGDAFNTAFKNKKILVRNQASWESAGYKWGTYWDSYGHPGQSGVRSSIMTRNTQGRYKTEIIEGETAYNWGANVWNPKYGASPTATLNNDVFTNNIIDAITELHCTGLGWLASYALDGSEGSNINTVKANASRIQKAFGYNYIIPEFSCSSRVDQGGELAIHFKVKNTGSAPFYDNWPLAFVLIDEVTQEIVWKEPISGVDVRNWLPGDMYSLVTKTYLTPAQEYAVDASLNVPGTIPTGQYMAAITILEPYSQTPGILFDTKNFLAKSQTQPLCRIAVGQDLAGDYQINPAIFGDPVVQDVRSYSLTPQGFGYNLTTNITNGTIVLHPAGGKYLPGTKVTVIVNSNFGHRFTSWSGDLSGSDKVTTITMDGDKCISANLEPVPTYELNTSAANGSVGINPSGNTFEEGSNVTLKANPDFGYQFSGWSGDLTGMDNPASIVMNSNKNITATFTQLEGTIVFATNCGGGAFTASDGVDFAADTNFSSGNAYSITAAIEGTTDDVLYQSERWEKSFSYNIPVPNGTYQVMLMFAEIYHTSANARVFNVALESSPVITNLDIWSEAGAKTAYHEAHLVTVTDDVLNISFTGVKDNAKISAIKILQTSIFSSIADNGSDNSPEKNELLKIYPNPFRTITTIDYHLCSDTPVKLSVYNLLGEHISTLVNGYQSAGNYSVDWNTANGRSALLANGLYLIKLETDNKSVQTMKAVLLR